MKRFSLNFLICAPAALALVACGDDGAAPAPPFEASVAAETQISTLDAATSQSLCSEAEAYWNANTSESALIRMNCTLTALIFGGLGEGEGASCQDIVNACVAEGSVEPENFTCDEFIDTTCQATVAEVSACLEAQVNALNSLAASISCSSSLQSLGNVGELPSGCRALQTKCPELFEDDDFEE